MRYTPPIKICNLQKKSGEKQRNDAVVSSFRNFPTHSNFRKVQGLLVSGPKSIAEHGTVAFAIWGEQERTVDAVHAAHRRGGG